MEHPNVEPARQTRRRFLAKVLLGAPAVAALVALLPWTARTSREPAVPADLEFPGPDSIFHPANDPRRDPRRNEPAK